jgi:hypothetical protein
MLLLPLRHTTQQGWLPRGSLTPCMPRRISVCAPAHFARPPCQPSIGDSPLGFPCSPNRALSPLAPNLGSWPWRDKAWETPLRKARLL